MIKLTDVSKSFKQQTLYKHVNLEISDGASVLFKGVNGSGKSVLLKLIVGYSLPTSGTIEVDGMILGKDTDFIPDAGVFINAPEFMNSWTGMENLMYLANIRQRATQEDIQGMARALKLEDDLSKKYKYYSLGMRQKLRLIQALMDRPKYLILDEPFDALDKTSQTQVEAMLSDYRKEHPESTLLFTSHNEAFHAIADTIYEIDDYQLIMEDSITPVHD